MAQKERFEGYDFTAEAAGEHSSDERHRTLQMAEAIMEVIFTDIIAVETFEDVISSIQLKEYDLKNGDNTTWTAKFERQRRDAKEVADDQNSTAEDDTYLFVTQQFYKAIHKLSAEFDYVGRFEVKLTLQFGYTEEFMEACGRMVTWLINDIYRTQIYTFFPEWETDYVDCVHFTEVD